MSLEIVYFKLYESQIPVIARALETRRLCWEATAPKASFGTHQLQASVYFCMLRRI